jgi:hypothetical protein
MEHATKIHFFSAVDMNNVSTSSDFSANAHVSNGTDDWEISFS